MNRISLQMYTLREYTKTIYDFENTLEKLSDIGFRTIQYSVARGFDSRKIADILNKFNIMNDSVFADFKELGDNSKAVLSDCELFGTDYVRIASMPRENAKSTNGYREFAHYLNCRTVDLKRHGKKLLYHFHAYEFRRFGDKCGIDIFMDESDPEVVELIPDTHWIHSGGKEIVPFLEKYRKRFDYIHVKDYAIGERLEKIEYRPIYFAPVGEGNLDWKQIIDYCVAHGTKSFAIEQDDCYGRDPFDCVRSSYEFLKEMGLD